MDFRTSGWVWDSSRQSNYYIDEFRNQRVYENGYRINIPRTFVGEQGTLEHAGQDRRTLENRQHPPVRDHRSFSESSQDNSYTIRRPNSAISPDATTSWPAHSSQPTRDEPGQNSPTAVDINELTALVDAKDLTFGDRNVQPGQQGEPKTEVHESPDHGFRWVTVVNPRTAVQTAFAHPSIQPITDPYLVRLGIEARRLLLPTPGEAERLHASFTIRRPGSRFFVEGRVFLMLWVEPAGSTADDNSTIASGQVLIDNPEIFPGRFGESVFSKVRRFVVIRAGGNYCSALAINSYGRRGVSKKDIKKSEHVIIHTSVPAPKPMEIEAPLREESGMRSQPIRVITDNPADTLDPFSRLDLGKVYTIHHNVKVKPFGMVHEGSKEALKTQFLNVFNEPTASFSSTHESHLRHNRAPLSHVPSSVPRGSGRISGRTRPPYVQPTRGTSSSSGLPRNRTGRSESQTGDRQEGGGGAGIAVTPRVEVPSNISPAEHQRAIFAYSAYQRLIRNGHSRQQALQMLVANTRREQTALDNQGAATLVRWQLAYVDNLPRINTQQHRGVDREVDNDGVDNEASGDGGSDDGDDDDDDDDDDEVIESGDER